MPVSRTIDCTLQVPMIEKALQRDTFSSSLYAFMRVTTAFFPGHQAAHAKGSIRHDDLFG